MGTTRYGNQDIGRTSQKIPPIATTVRRKICLSCIDAEPRGTRTDYADHCPEKESQKDESSIEREI